MAQKHCFKVDKLVRDKLPEILHEAGVEVSVRVMEKDEYITRLQDKLLEEAHEVIDAVHQTEIRNELADVLEVMMTLARINDIEFTDVVKTAEQRRLARGGFDKRIYAAFVKVEPGNPRCEYYKAHPDRYPEIL